MAAPKTIDRSGQCNCGQVKFTVTGNVLANCICHCKVSECISVATLLISGGAQGGSQQPVNNVLFLSDSICLLFFIARSMYDAVKVSYV